MTICYGYTKKTVVPINLVEIFQAFATIPEEGITCDDDRIEKNEIDNYEKTLEEVFFLKKNHCL